MWIQNFRSPIEYNSGISVVPVILRGLSDNELPAENLNHHNETS